MAKRMEKGKELAKNPKARHDYYIEETIEAGLVLKGTEVKSIRKGSVSLKESYCEIRGGEVWAIGMHISPYKEGNIFNTDPLRKKKLLLNRREIRKLEGKIAEQGYTLTILSLYLNNGRIKALLALAKGKKLYDKRESAKNKEIDKRLHERVKNIY